MSFVIYDVNTKRLVGTQHETQAGAKISMAAKLKKDAKMAVRYGKNWQKAELAVTTLAEYNANIRTTKTVNNLMSGKEIEIDINTPLCCDPSSETYWSM